MASPSLKHDGKPPPADVRAQVERMTASEIFSNSPQLAAFLLFIVEAVLRGKSERIKGYTIGVEVLRRDAKFDPQVDPIVRVEATRLRRAIGRYYAGPGAADPIVIDLPRGGYVPTIAWSAEAETARAPPPAPERTALAPGNGMPTLRVAPFVVLGTPDTRVIAAETFGSKIAEAFAQFDIVNVMMAAPPSPRPTGALAAVQSSPGNHRSDYRLDGTVEYRGRTVDLRFKLVDESDATVIWSRAFEQLSGTEDSGEVERGIIRELANAIVQPFGVISANDRAKRLAGDSLDPRYRALFEGGDALRTFDPAMHARARERLEQLTAIDPNFAIGFTLLAALYAREYMTGFGARHDDPPALDRALKAARHGIELKPQSARAYHILFTVLFFRGEKEAAIVAAEKAIALNPCDALITSDFGGRLIYYGEVERGMGILRDAVGFGAILPSWTHFSMFVGHYACGNLAEARYHASQLTSETHVYGQLARALIAHADGDTAETVRAMRAILALRPVWRTDPLGEIGRVIKATAIAERMVRDLAAVGFPDAALQA